MTERTEQKSKSDARLRKVFKVALSGGVAKVVNICCSLILVPLALGYLGKSEYGIWIAVSSLIAMLGFMDGGAGNAVINLVSHAYGADKTKLPKIVSTGYIVLSLFALSGLLMFLSAYPFVSWASLLGVEDARTEQLKQVILLVAILFFASMVISLIGKIQRGMQKGNLDNLWIALGSILSLILVYLAIRLDLGLIGFAAAFLIGGLISYAVSNLHYLVFLHPEMVPRVRHYDQTIAKSVVTVGGMFLAVQIAGRVQYFADNVIVSNMLGPAAVTNYAVCMQLFVSTGSIFALGLVPLWPAYREAIASGEVQWVKRTFNHSLKWSLGISVPLAIVMVLAGKKIVELWTGGAVSPGLSLLIGCALWMVCLAGGNALAMLLNAIQLVKAQAIVALVSGFANIFLTVFLIGKMGVEGAAYASVVSYLVCTVIPCYFLVRNFFNKMTDE